MEVVFGEVCTTIISFVEGELRNKQQELKL